jgi:hypothetical protein
MRDKDNKGELNGKCNIGCRSQPQQLGIIIAPEYYCAHVQKRLNNDISISRCFGYVWT